ncbi:MAG: 4'-phosphopantetheinyl transferase family protein [Vicinamibacterales bacterium]
MTSGTIHLWTIDLDADPVSLGSFLNLLSGDERVRAARLRTTELRLRFVIAHGALRAILARYVGIAAAAIRLDVTASGKPFVPGAPVTFNLSHSEGLAVCAVAPGRHIGVDVERLRPVPDADSIVQRYFAPGEARGYAALPAMERVAAFFSTWTRKEAFVKAIGDGLQVPLDSFEVDIAPSEVEPRIAMDASRGAWHLRSFEPAPGYAGAVACDGPIGSIRRFAFDEQSLDMPFEPV